jgi:HK97 family phage prohead protease
MVKKQYIATISKVPALGDRVREFVISTGHIDRDNDRVAVAGWKLDNYRKNPVVLFAHDYSGLPVARCLSLRQQGDELIAAAEFAKHEQAQTVLDLIDGGFLNATSVGFRPVGNGTPNQFGGTDFPSAELLEFSIVPVPANPEALVLRLCGATEKSGRAISAANSDHINIAHAMLADMGEDFADLRRCLRSVTSKHREAVDRLTELKRVADHNDDSDLDGHVHEVINPQPTDDGGDIIDLDIDDDGDDTPTYEAAAALFTDAMQTITKSVKRDEIDIDRNKLHTMARETARAVLREVIAEEVARGLRMARGRLD